MDDCSPWVNPETASVRYHPPRPDLSLGIEREPPYRFVRVNRDHRGRMSVGCTGITSGSPGIPDRGNLTAQWYKPHVNLSSIPVCSSGTDQQRVAWLPLEVHSAQLSLLVLMPLTQLPACPSVTHLDMNLPFPSLVLGLLFHLRAEQFHSQTLTSAVVAPPTSIGVVWHSICL